MYECMDFMRYSRLIWCRYSEPEKFAVVEIDVPSIGDDDVLVSFSEHVVSYDRTKLSRSRSRHAAFAGQIYTITKASFLQRYSRLLTPHSTSKLITTAVAAHPR